MLQYCLREGVRTALKGRRRDGRDKEAGSERVRVSESEGESEGKNDHSDFDKLIRQVVTYVSKG